MTSIIEVNIFMGRPPGRIQGHQFQMRVSDKFLRSIDAWRRKQDDKPSRAEAIRRLVEQALGSSTETRPIGARAQDKAAELASDEIDRLGDAAASGEERTQRKRRLIKGPREFRELRGKSKK
jgi:hypothetical protein